MDTLERHCYLELFPSLRGKIGNNTICTAEAAAANSKYQHRRCSQECLGEMTTLQLEAPADELVAVGTQGTIRSALNVTAGTEGGPVVWEVNEVKSSSSKEVREGRGREGNGGGPLGYRS